MIKCRVCSSLPQNASSALKHFLLSRVYAKAAQLNMAADILASDVREVTLGAQFIRLTLFPQGELGLFSMMDVDAVTPEHVRFLTGWRAGVIGWTVAASTHIVAQLIIGNELLRIRRGVAGIRWNGATTSFSLLDV